MNRNSRNGLTVAMTAVLLSCFVGSGFSQHNRLIVDLDALVQADFLGVNAVYHGFAFMPEQVEKGMSAKDTARELARVSAMRLNIARTWYGPEMMLRFAGGAHAYDWDSPHMMAFYAWLQEMKDRNVDVALSLGWWFPRHVDLVGGIAAYAEWISESLHQMIDLRGLTNIKYGFLFTEPEGDYAAYVQTARMLDARLRADGRRDHIKIVGPNQAGRAWLEAIVRDLDDVIDIYSGHRFQLRGYADWKISAADKMRRVAGTGKPFWYDEFGDRPYGARTGPVYGGDYGNYLAQAAAGMINAGVVTCTLWMLFDQQYCVPHDKVTNRDDFFDGVHRWGLCKWPHDTLPNPTYPYRSWYAFSLMSRYLGGRDGTRVYRTTSTDQAALCAIEHPDGHWSFMVVNLIRTEIPIEVMLSRPIGRTLHRYLYDPVDVIPDEAAQVIGSSRVFEDVGQLFEDRLPGQGVAIYSTILGP